MGSFVSHASEFLAGKLITKISSKILQKHMFFTYLINGWKVKQDA